MKGEKDIKKRRKNREVVNTDEQKVEKEKNRKFKGEREKGETRRSR